MGAVNVPRTRPGYLFFLVAAFFLAGVAFFFVAGAAFFLAGAFLGAAFFFAGAGFLTALAGAFLAGAFLAAALRAPPTTLRTPGPGITVDWLPLSHSTVTSVPLTRRTTPSRGPDFDCIETRSPTSAIV